MACPIHQCVRREHLARLALYQWKIYGTVLECLKGTDVYDDIESLEEIDRLMRQRPRTRRPKRG